MTYTAHTTTMIDGEEVEVTIKYTVSQYFPETRYEPAEHPTPEIINITIGGAEVDALRWEEIVAHTDDEWLLSEARDEAQRRAEDRADMMRGERV